jgi:hypothetical protein
MSQVRRFNKLPEAVQREIKARLQANGFSDFVALAEELQGRGYRISKSGLHRAIQLLRSDAEFLRGWALANPEQAAAMVATLKSGGRVSLTTEVSA